MHDALTIFESGAATHVGKVRRRNEDLYLVQPQTGLWAVADGMGGEEAGDVASAAVIEALQSIEPPTSAAELLTRCEDRVVEVNRQLTDIARERGEGTVIGTTLAMLLTYDDHFACIWAGDSRIYRIRGDQIEQISRDHTEVQTLVEDGVITAEEAKTWPGRNVITRAIGVYDEPELEMEHGKLTPDDTFVLCSDGLTAHIGDGEILENVVGIGSQQACDALIALTLERGAVDNVTVVVVRYRPTVSPPESEEHDSVRLQG